MVGFGAVNRLWPLTAWAFDPNPNKEKGMAKNFRMITSEQADHTFRIQLKGDFDGTSAHELANMLTDFGSSFAHVAIDTDGLRTLYAFGLNLFSAKLKMLTRSPTRIMFYGKFKNNFAEE